MRVTRIRAIQIAPRSFEGFLGHPGRFWGLVIGPSGQTGHLVVALLLWATAVEDLA
jgi:hypothetical protein